MSQRGRGRYAAPGHGHDPQNNVTQRVASSYDNRYQPVILEPFGHWAGPVTDDGSGEEEVL